MREMAIISGSRLEDAKNGYIRPVRCYFQVCGLHAGDLWSPYDYMVWVSKCQSEFFAQRKPGPTAVLSDEFYQWLEDQVDSGRCSVPQRSEISERVNRRERVKC